MEGSESNGGSYDDLPPPPKAFGLTEEWIVAAPTKGEVLYRLVNSEPPRPRDFESNWDKGRPRAASETAITQRGLSFFDAADQAASRSIRSTTVIAAVELVSGKGFQIAKTFTEGHYTVWGDPDDLLALAMVV